VEPLIETFVDAVEQLQKSWADDVVRGTSWALGNIGDARAINPLIDSLIDMLNVEQWGNVWPLRQPGEYTVAECIPSITDALAKLDKDAMEPLINPLIKALGIAAVLGADNEHTEIPRVAAVTLGKIGEPAVECLVKALEDNDENVRHNALMALSSRNCVSFLVNGTGSIQNDIVEMLVKILVIDSTNYMTSFMAVRLLGEIGDTRAIEPLKKALDNTRTHQVAKEALKKLGHDVE
jgi:HEAT repeat protein